MGGTWHIGKYTDEEPEGLGSAWMLWKSHRISESQLLIYKTIGLIHFIGFAMKNQYKAGTVKHIEMKSLRVIRSDGFTREL